MDKTISSKENCSVAKHEKSSISKLLAQISCNSSSSYKALVNIRTKVLKQSDGLIRLRQSGGTKVLLDILDKPEQKLHDVCLSILGNCCLDHHFRTEVLQRDGVSMIGLLLQETKSPSIQNRACRTLANISLDPSGCREVHRTEGLLETIINILKESLDPECQQTFIRTIRLLSDTESHRTAILDLRGLKTVADFLVSDVDSVSQASLKVIDHFINQQPTAQCALQLDLASVPKHIVAAVNNKSPGSIQYYNSLIHTMMKHECFRPGLGNNGAIQYFIARIADGQLPVRQQYISINSLCLSCKESLNRVRIREHSGLELLIDVLSDKSLFRIHDRVISALLCFLYDEPSLQNMLKHNIIDVLMKHLAACPEWQVQESLSSAFSAALGQCLDDVVLIKPHLIDEDGQETSIMKGGLSPESKAGHKIMMCEDDGCKTSIKTREGDDLCAGKSGCPECPKEENSDQKNITAEDHSDAKCPRYSMDSPTYKEISQSVDDQTYKFSGPRNIYECQAFSDTSSSVLDCWSSGSSMPCLSPCSQSSYSPISNISGFYSPDCSPKSSLSDQLTVSPPAFDLSDIPANSPSHVYSPIQMMSYSSPSKNSSSSSLSGSKTGSHDSLLALEYSSEEEDFHDLNEEQTTEHQYFGKHQMSGKPKKATITNILMFLSRVSFMENPSKYLLKWCVLDGLVGFLMRNQHDRDDMWNRASRILTRVFQTPYLDVVVINAVPLLVNLMSEECLIRSSEARCENTSDNETNESQVKEVFKLPCSPVRSRHGETVGVDLLNILSIEAQNLYGRGVIIHALITGAVTERVKTYLSLPFLYKDPEDLKSMMSYVPGGLDLIAHLLGSKDEVLQNSAMSFLRSLLQIFNRHPFPKHFEWHAKKVFLNQIGKKRKRNAMDDVHQCPKVSKQPKLYSVASNQQNSCEEFADSTVKLICSDKNTVMVSRTILSASSDVFNTMLSGSFCEAKQSTVAISDFTSNTINLFVEYLHGNRPKSTDIPIHSLLELLRLADQYLIHPLHLDVCESLMEWLDDCIRSLATGTTKNCQAKDISVLLTASLLFSCHWFSKWCLTKILSHDEDTFPVVCQRQVIRNAIESSDAGLYPSAVSNIMSVIKQLLE